MAGVSEMTRVVSSDDPDDPLVLIVDYNPMGVHRLSQVFTQKGWRIEICEDGDEAVDEYVRLKPDLVLLSLDIPSLDGHIAALEMRETDPTARIVFMAPRHQRTLAADATLSAGATVWLEKPVTSAAIEEAWGNIMGEIPEAVGLEDLDQLYPDVDSQRAQKDGEEVVDVAVALPPPGAASLPDLKLEPTTDSKVKKKGKKAIMIVAALLFLGAFGAIGAGVYLYLGV